MTQGLCVRNKFAFCKFIDKCRFRHNNVKCTEKTCSIYNCEKRHPKICKHFREYGYCKFTTYCRYEHKKQVHIAENSDNIAKLEKKFQRINFQNSNIEQSENYDKLHIDKLEEKITEMGKTMEKSLEAFEKKLDNQRNNLEEKNAKITAL